MVGEQSPENEAGDHHPATLRGDVGEYIPPAEPSGQREADRHGRIEVAAGEVAEGIDQRHHDQPEDERHADMGDIPAAEIIRHDRPGADEDEDKTPERFGAEFPDGIGRHGGMSGGGGTDPQHSGAPQSDSAGRSGRPMARETQPNGGRKQAPAELRLQFGRRLTADRRLDGDRRPRHP